MNILVTAGNTLVPIDRVRCLTNTFTGRTGAQIAVYGYEQGHRVTLLTSRPEAVAEVATDPPAARERWIVQRYTTFDELQNALSAAVLHGGFDVIIHSAAVSDYRVEGVYAPAPGTGFHPNQRDGYWDSTASDRLCLLDRRAGKVKSDEPELWLRLVRTPKLVDQIRTEWGFRGLLVKFKLEVEIGDGELLRIAERSRRQSGADLMVANTLEGAAAWAYLGPFDGGGYLRVPREELPARLFATLAQRRREPHNG
jgi:phosphopantothenoylcysteine synthetase/decarboxylase